MIIFPADGCPSSTALMSEFDSSKVAVAVISRLLNLRQEQTFIPRPHGWSYNAVLIDWNRL